MKLVYTNITDEIYQKLVQSDNPDSYFIEITTNYDSYPEKIIATDEIPPECNK